MPAAKPETFSSDLVAPLSGTVVERPVFSGQYVGEGTKLLTIVDSSVLRFRFDVYERQLPWLALGQTIDVEVPAVPGKVFSAVISLIEPDHIASQKVAEKIGMRVAGTVWEEDIDEVLLYEIAG